MKILFLSNLYPDSSAPGRGIYNARLVEHLHVFADLRVVSPRPVLPFASSPALAARAEDHAHAPVFPPAWYLPKIGHRWNHSLMARSLRTTLALIRRDFPYDVILASWAYPDGCAAALLASEFHVPCAVICQGSDIHQYLHIPARREVIREHLSRAGAIVARSEDLAAQLRAARLPADRIQVIYNGVDFEKFHPADKRLARQHLGISQDEKVILFVGNFLPIKNPLLLLEAFAAVRQRLPRARLVLVGEGPLRPEIEARARAAGLAEHLSLPGQKDEYEVACHMQAADCLCIPSDNEGLPNVLLESLACGLPAVATRVGGNPEVLTEPHLGRLVLRGNAAEMAAAISGVMSQAQRVGEIHEHAKRYSWARTASTYHQLLQRLVAGRGAVQPPT